MVKAGETMSESFSVKTFVEKVQIDQDGFGGAGAHEGTENFNVAITGVDGSTADDIEATGDVTTEIVDKTIYSTVSPVAVDLNKDGEIGVTGATSSWNKDPNAPLGATVDFDMNGDGVKEKIEWIDGKGDALLVDVSKIKSDGSIDGTALFGDDSGSFNNGFEKLAGLDANSDGKLTGNELSKLGAWVDDGDAVLEAGEMKSVSDFGIVEMSVEMENVTGSDGLQHMQSTATLADGSTLLTEDVWFAADGSSNADPVKSDDMPIHHDDPNCQ